MGKGKWDWMKPLEKPENAVMENESDIIMSWVKNQLYNGVYSLY